MIPFLKELVITMLGKESIRYSKEIKVIYMSSVICTNTVKDNV